MKRGKKPSRPRSCRLSTCSGRGPQPHCRWRAWHGRGQWSGRQGAAVDGVGSRPLPRLLLPPGGRGCPGCDRQQQVEMGNAGFEEKSEPWLQMRESSPPDRSSKPPPAHPFMVTRHLTALSTADRGLPGSPGKRREKGVRVWGRGSSW